MATPDPDIEEMRAFCAELLPDTFADDGCEVDVEEAIYWFASHNHSGQGSNLYEALCTTKFQPGPISHGPDSDGALLLYNELTEEFR